jgi:hypothetical protein
MRFIAKFKKWLVPVQWLVLVLILCIALILAIRQFNKIVDHIEFRREMKLADCTNSTLKVHLKIPKGGSLCLVLVTPSSPSNIFSGHIRISSGASSNIDFPISSDSARQSSFQGVSNFSLTGGFQNTNQPLLSQFVQAQRDYDIEFAFDIPPSPSSSVWLRWLQASIDFRQESKDMNK